MSRILFIGHHGNRSGAPLVLLYYLQWLRENNPHLGFDLLLLCGGELEPEYRKVADVYVLPKDEKSGIARRGIGYLKRKAGFKSARFVPFERQYDVVLGNTIVSLETLAFFKRKGCHTICWLHELEYVVNVFLGQKFAGLSDSIDEFIVPSNAVEKMLKSAAIEKKTHLVYEFSKTEPNADNDIESVEDELGIPANAFIVAGSGTVEWRKGVDLFLQIAARTIAEKPDVYFVWVSGRSAGTDAEYRQIQHDFKRMDLEGRVIITGAHANPQKIFARMDLFALTSREDPFPLVCLEAAAFGKPIICFENAGGIPEFVETDAGAIVAYGDTNAFSEKIIYFYDHPQERRQAGETARNKVNTKFSADKSYRAIDAILERFIN